MNKLFASLILIVPFSSVAQYEAYFHADQINLLTVSIDYQDYSFSGASMNYYDCTTCTSDSLPYEIDYVYPSDFGSMTFKLNPSNDVIFQGGIVWMGQGQMSHPLLSLNTDPPFDNIGNPLPVPSNISYLDFQGSFVPGNSETDLAWEAVSQLRIVQLIADNEYDVLCYFYAPSVGIIDPDPAKWIFFFYKNNYFEGPVGIAENNKLNVSIYPNPATEKLNFTSPFNLEAYTIQDVAGKMIESGKPTLSKEINVAHLPSGVYFIEFESEQGEKQQLKWIKQ